MPATPQGAMGQNLSMESQMGWSDLDKKDGSGLSGRFVKVKSDAPVRLRFLDEEPYTTFVHKVTGKPDAANKDGVFRSIAATPKLDDDHIQAVNGKRFPAVAQYNMRCFEFKRDDKGKFTDEGEIKILQGGPGIFKPLRGICEESGSLRDYDILISAAGTGRDTEYAVTASPMSRNIDVNALLTKLEQDPTLAWENVFPIMTAEMQKKILFDSKIDITYDPVAEIVAVMSLDQALGTTLAFGKYKGKTVQDVMVIDASWIEWAGANVTSNDSVAAACQIAFGNVSALASGDTPQPQLPPAPKSTPAATAKPPKASPAKDEARAALVASVSSKLEDLPAPKIVAAIKEHGAGKTRLKDLNIEQLTALDAAL